MSKNILITGATGALGSLTSKVFAMQGHNLILMGTNQNKLDSLAKDLNLQSNRFLTQALDLTNANALQTSVETALSKFGSIHALFHLIGGWVGGKTFTDTSYDDFEFMLNQHVRSTFNLFKSLSKPLSGNNWGRVIIVSASTVTNPPGKSGVYTAAKAAQENMVLSLANELKEYKVTANVIQVKAIDVENKGKGTTPAEIVSTMQYLFSDEAEKISGARIPLY
ncbi:MAG: SDR family oxidoreductase [Anaerolineales bacterium]|nr:SDR family oxidoreductase [Anaerolineales bacterium]